MPKTITLEPNWKNVYRFVMAMTPKERNKFIKNIGQDEWKKLKAAAGVKEEVAKTEKKKLDESITMLSSLLPVGGVHGLAPKRKDNFEFKGLPGQFDEDGNKILDEYGQPIQEETVNESTEAGALHAQLDDLAGKISNIDYRDLEKMKESKIDYVYSQMRRLYVVLEKYKLI